MKKASRKIMVICGSKSDFEQIVSGLAILEMAEANGNVEVLSVEVCSAHRNPTALRKLLLSIALQEVDVVLLCAGKLAALFGDCDAISRNELGNSLTRFVVVPLRGESEASCMAAYLSAKEVPNSQFVFKEEFYEDPQTAFEYAVYGKFPEIKIEKQKSPESFDLKTARKLARRTYPPKAAYDEIIDLLESWGFIHIYTGKTREVFLNPLFPRLLFILATDRISIFDKVLNAKIPGKGAALTAMTVHWLKNVFSDVPNHLVAYGGEILAYLPKELTEKAESSFLTYLMKNMLVVRRANVIKVEAIVRDKLTGSGYKDYKETGEVCGIKLPEGLVDGSDLPETIFTPSTKAPYGMHDKNISYEEAKKIVGVKVFEKIKQMSLDIFQRGKEHLAECGIILADMKLEFGYDPTTSEIFLIDEVLTSDSSRFWPKKGWLKAMQEKKTPPSFDKQIVRDEGEAAGIKDVNPEWVPSDDLVSETSKIYGKMVSLAVGKTIARFWADEMQIHLN
jgi:phosphoribosylaminoimidazole-succinocarboxamide synthase